MDQHFQHGQRIPVGAAVASRFGRGAAAPKRVSGYQTRRLLAAVVGSSAALAPTARLNPHTLAPCTPHTAYRRYRSPRQSTSCSGSGPGSGQRRRRAAGPPTGPYLVPSADGNSGGNGNGNENENEPRNNGEERGTTTTTPDGSYTPCATTYGKRHNSA
jgi:hypothetical protein